MSTKQRCEWVTQDQFYQNYHDNEWGIPLYDEHLLFELLILECMHAGLNWLLILKKRNNYRECFDNFDTNKIIHYDNTKIEQLMTNTGIIRHKLKINSIIHNSHAFLNIKQKYGNFSDYIWSFVNGKPIKNHWKNYNEVPSTSDISDLMSIDLKKHGFKFIGSTTCYAFMQASGMVNDHTINCYCY